MIMAPERLTGLYGNFIYSIYTHSTPNRLPLHRSQAMTLPPQPNPAAHPAPTDYFDNGGGGGGDPGI